MSERLEGLKVDRPLAASRRFRTYRGVTLYVQIEGRAKCPEKREF